jgi:predicted ATPase
MRYSTSSRRWWIRGFSRVGKHLISDLIGATTMYHFEHFKNFANAELDLVTPLTVLIGTNGSGKSNVIEAIELLSFIVHGGLLHDIGDLGSGSDRPLKIRGGLQFCPSFGQEACSLGFRTAEMSYTLNLQIKPRPKIRQERLEVRGELIVDTSEWQVSAPQSIFSPYPEDFSAHLESLSHWRKVLRDALPRPLIVEPRPWLMRTYEDMKNDLLAPHGSNLSAVLYALSQGTEEDKQTLDRLLGWIKQLPDEPYQAISFVTTEFDDVIFGFKEAPEKPLVSAKLLSDGTLRSLAILTALETVKPHSLVVIEEFDNSLHPSRVAMLVTAMAECSQRRQLTVLGTTHNSTTLNVLQTPREQLEGVVLCRRDAVAQSSQLIRFLDLPLLEEILERGHLGDTITRRLTEQYLEPGFEEERIQEALKWSEQLRLLREEFSS